MWQTDTCYLPHITEGGQRRRVYCIMIIDDHSRFLVGGLFYNDNAYNFQKVLKDAVAAHGIPVKLYVDYSDNPAMPIFNRNDRFLPFPCIKYRHSFSWLSCFFMPCLPCN